MVKTTNVIRLFLASSSELKNDREQFEIFLARKNKEYIKDNIFLELVIWEDFLDAMSPNSLQDEYNKVIANCDVFVSLFWTKVGQYTEEEFEKAFATFKTDKKPLVYTFFKESPILPSQAKQILNLFNFQSKLSDLGHFYTNYSDINDLKYKFNEQLNKILPSFLTSNENDQRRQTHRKLFISYSHRDKTFLDRLLIHLSPLAQEGVIDLWVDTKLTAGEQWKETIEESLQTASVAILLVSADFLASEFIVNNELPSLLKAAKEEGTRIIPIILKPCRFSRDKRLSIYQAANLPERPLAKLSEVEQEEIYDKVSELVEALLGTT